MLGKCYIGDWFLLFQLSKNVNTYFYRAFIKELKNELREKPKRSRSLRSDNGKVGRGNGDFGAKEREAEKRAEAFALEEQS